VGKPEGKRTLGRLLSGWMDLRKTKWGDVDWSELVQDRDRWRTLEKGSAVRSCCGMYSDITRISAVNSTYLHVLYHSICVSVTYIKVH
jgi:hypothetical protein